MAAPFAFVVDADERKFLNEAFRACTVTRSWNALRLRSQPSVERRATQDLRAEMDMSEHSGFTTSWTLSELRRAARQGLQQYKNEYLAQHEQR